MHTVGDSVWVDAAVVDRFLLQRWAPCKDTSPVIYLSIATISACTQTTPPADSEMAALRKGLFLPEGTADDRRSVVFIHYDHTRKHYFLCAFDYRKSRVLTWGRNFNITASNTKRWNASMIWDRIAPLLGQEDTPTKPSLWFGVDWTQVSRP